MVDIYLIKVDTSNTAERICLIHGREMLRSLRMRISELTAPIPLKIENHLVLYVIHVRNFYFDDILSFDTPLVVISSTSSEQDETTDRGPIIRLARNQNRVITRLENTINTL